MIILMDILNVLGFFFTILGIIYLLIWLVKKIKKKKATYKFIFTAGFIFLTGLNLLWLVSFNPVKINTNSVVTTSNNYPKPISLNLKTVNNLDFSYNPKYIIKEDRDGVPAFTIKSTELTDSTKLIVKQNYYNEFLVPVVEQNHFLIKKVQDK